jgi:hypothetical protein
MNKAPKSSPRKTSPTHVSSSEINIGDKSTKASRKITHLIDGVKLHLDPRYNPLDKSKKLKIFYLFKLIVPLVGQGSYGVVMLTEDTSEENEKDRYVALKKIEKAFEHRVFTKRTLRELKILRLLRHENVSDS